VAQNIPFPLFELRLEKIQFFSQNKARKTKRIEIILDSFNKIRKAIHLKVNVIKFVRPFTTWVVPIRRRIGK